MTTSNLSLPLMSSGQAQKHVTFNEALSRIDSSLHIHLEEMNVVDLPYSPSEGVCLLISQTPSSSLAEHAGEIACWKEGSWLFFKPSKGWTALSPDTKFLVHDGIDFLDPTPTELDQLEVDSLGIGGAPSAGNAVTVTGASSLFNNDGGDVAINLNRSSPGDTAGIRLQTGFSSEFEITLNDASTVSFKTLQDNTLAATMEIDAETGYIGIGGAPAERLRVSQGLMRVGHHMLSAHDAAGTAGLKVAYYGSGDRPAFIDFHASDANSASYDTRIIRKSGEHGQLLLDNRGDGGIELSSRNTGPVLLTTNNGPVVLQTQSIERIRVAEDGKIGVGTNAPSTTLDVKGPVRVGQLDESEMPSAAAVGAGALIYVTSGAQAPYLAISTGAEWSRLAQQPAS